jgi:hypothetical protein
MKNDNYKDCGEAKKFTSFNHDFPGALSAIKLFDLYIYNIVACSGR